MVVWCVFFVGCVVGYLFKNIINFRCVRLPYYSLHNSHIIVVITWPFLYLPTSWFAIIAAVFSIYWLKRHFMCAKRHFFSFAFNFKIAWYSPMPCTSPLNTNSMRIRKKEQMTKERKRNLQTDTRYIHGVLVLRKHWFKIFYFNGAL